jgi:hypothetical protein
MKRETLEEAVKNYCIKKYSVWVSDSDKSDDFINGAKWQAERMYSEEDMKKAFNSSSFKIILDAYDSFEEFIAQFKKK